jgi:type IV pilus assembly protein PilC
MPLVSRLYFKNCGYEYLYAVYLMYSGGSSIVESLEGAAAVLKDRYLKEQITKCAAEIMKGSSIMEALIGMEVIDYTSLSIIRLGEESGKLTEMLKRLLIIIEDDLNSLMEKLLELIQPASIILVGALVGTIVLSIALPMFSMYNL